MMTCSLYWSICLGFKDDVLLRFDLSTLKTLRLRVEWIRLFASWGLNGEVESDMVENRLRNLCIETVMS